MKFPKSNTGPRHVLLRIVQSSGLTLEEIMDLGISTETKQRNRVVRILQSLLNSQCIYAINGKYHATEDAVAYAEDLVEMESKKRKVEVVGAPYVRPFNQAPTLKGYTTSLYYGKRGYD